MLAAFKVPFSRFGAGNLARSIQQPLIAMSMDCATSARASTEASQLAEQASAPGGDVFPAQALWVQTPGPHDLIGRTAIGVAQWMVAKMLLRINALSASLASEGITQELHMGSDLSLLTTNQVADAAVAGIGNHGSNRLLSGVFLGFDEPE